MNINPIALDFIDAETWIINTLGTFEAWIESGITAGNPRASSAPYDFWAVGRTDGNYYQHFDTTDAVVYGTGYRQSITRDTSTSFIAKIGPFVSAPITGWPSNYKFTKLQTGSEATHNNVVPPLVTLYAQSYDLHYYDENEALHYPWVYGAVSVVSTKDPTNWGYINPLATNAAYEYGTVTSGC